MDGEVIPLKQVAAELGVSRATLWRASRSGIAGFPAPTNQRGRTFWRREELSALEAALDVFRGRGAFERARRHARACNALAQVVANRAARPQRRKQVASELRQPDLFGGPLTHAPSGAERLK